MSVLSALLKGFVMLAAITLLFYYLLQSGFISKLLYQNPITGNAIPIPTLLQNASHYYGRHVQVIGTLLANPSAQYNLYPFIGSPNWVALYNVSQRLPVYGYNYSVSGVLNSTISTSTCTTKQVNCTIQIGSTGNNKCTTIVNCTHTVYYIEVTNMTRLP
jgi:hypothetical protein